MGQKLLAYVEGTSESVPGLVVVRPKRTHLDAARMKGAQVKAAKAAAFAATVLPLIVRLRADGLSLQKIAATLNKRGVKTATGIGAWTATSVRRILARQPDRS